MYKAGEKWRTALAELIFFAFSRALFHSRDFCCSGVNMYCRSMTEMPSANFYTLFLSVSAALAISSHRSGRGSSLTFKKYSLASLNIAAERDAVTVSYRYIKLFHRQQPFILSAARFSSRSVHHSCSLCLSERFMLFLQIHTPLLRTIAESRSPHGGNKINYALESDSKR
jgi:hypothetical protein